MNLVAEYFRFRWPKRLAGDFKNGPVHSSDPRHAINAMNSVADTASNHTHQAINDDATIAALHAAENEGWKPQPEPVAQHHKWSLPARRADARRDLEPR